MNRSPGSTALKRLMTEYRGRYTYILTEWKDTILIDLFFAYFKRIDIKCT